MHTPPSADPKWHLAGQFTVSNGGSIGIWHLNGVPHLLQESLSVAEKPSSDAVASVAPSSGVCLCWVHCDSVRFCFCVGSAAVPTAPPSTEAYVDVVVLACKNLLGVTYFQRAQCKLSVYSKKVTATSTTPCSTECVTPFTTIANSAASWYEPASATVDVVVPTVQALRQRMPVDLAALQKPVALELNVSLSATSIYSLCIN